MEQMKLFEIIQRMSPGQEIDLRREEMLACAEGNIKSLLFDGPARDSDIAEFVSQLSENWGLHITHDFVKDKWKLVKK